MTSNLDNSIMRQLHALMAKYLAPHYYATNKNIKLCGW
jgi:hypothetical protein